MKLRIYQTLLLLGVFVVWHVLTATEILPSFFFGKPLVVLEKTWEWFASGKIYSHLWITLVETVLAFGVGTLLGLAIGCGSRSRRWHRRCSTLTSRHSTRCRG